MLFLYTNMAYAQTSQEIGNNIANLLDDIREDISKGQTKAPINKEDWKNLQEKYQNENGGISSSLSRTFYTSQKE